MSVRYLPLTLFHPPFIIEIFFIIPYCSYDPNPYPNPHYFSDQLRQRLVRMSVRHHEQLFAHQQREIHLMQSLQEVRFEST